MSATRKQTVFGQGNPNARLVFVGEASPLQIRAALQAIEHDTKAVIVEQPYITSNLKFQTED